MCLDIRGACDSATEGVRADANNGSTAPDRQNENSSLSNSVDAHASPGNEEASAYSCFDSSPPLQGHQCTLQTDEKNAVVTSHIDSNELPCVAHCSKNDSKRRDAILYGEISASSHKRQRVGTSGECVTPVTDRKSIVRGDSCLAQSVPQPAVDGAAGPTDSTCACADVGFLEGGTTGTEVEARAGSDGTAPNATCEYSSVSSHTYNNAWILAPMVRVSVLPFRLECLKYGAGKEY